MARLKCPCGVWIEIDEMLGHRQTPDHAGRMKTKLKMLKPKPSDQTRQVMVPRPWRATPDR
jgi:hypothetical protein